MSEITEVKMDPFTRFVRELDEPYWLLREAANILGVNHRVLRDINSDESKKAYWASFFTYMGKVKIYLYTDDDIELLRKYFQERRTVYPVSENPPHKMGRPSKYTAEEKAHRQRLFSKANYYKKQAQKHTNMGKHDMAREDIKKMKQVQEELSNG